MLNFCGCDDGMCASCADTTMTGEPRLFRSYLVLPGGARVNADEVLALPLDESLLFLARLGFDFRTSEKMRTAMERCLAAYAEQQNGQ